MNAGDDAIDLAASAGLILDAEQQLVMRDALGHHHGGRWAANAVALIEPRQNGKGAVLEARTLAGLFLFGERLILWSAHEFKTAQEAFLRVRALIENAPHLARRVARVRTAAGSEGIELTNGARLRFIARSRGAGRGFSADCILLDEAYALTDEQMSAILPTLSARPNTQTWYTSSAPLPDSVVLRRLMRRGREGAPGLTYLEWCADDDADSDDEQAWRQANPALGTRLSLEAVRRERDAMTDEDFRRERLGIVDLDDVRQWQVIRERQWMARRVDRLQLRDPVAIAADVTPDRTWAAIGAAGQLLNGSGRGVELVDHRPGTSWVIPALKRLSEVQAPCVIVVTDRALADAAEEEGLRVILANGGNMASAATMLYDGIAGTSPHVSHLGSACCGDKMCLDDAVAGATTRPLGDSWAWDRRSVSVDISPLVAVSVALWGLSTPRVHTAVAPSPFVLIGQ